MTEETLVANYCKGGKSTGGPFITISVMGDYNTGDQKIPVKGKVAARKKAAEYGAKCWNF
mgnify:CR=1 FL=1